MPTARLNTGTCRGHSPRVDPPTAEARRRRGAFYQTCPRAACARGPCGYRTWRPQSTATANAEQTSRIRLSSSLPSRSVSVLTEMLSTESRLTADRRGIGSSPGSSSTSLANPRIVVVHGATSALRSLGMATSRERTTTGRREMSGSSHHHTSPLVGMSVTTKLPLLGMMRGHPIRRTHRVERHRKSHIWHRSQRLDAGRAGRRGLHPEEPHPSNPTAIALPAQAVTHQLSCLLVLVPCHNHATNRA